MQTDLILLAGWGWPTHILDPMMLKLQSYYKVTILNWLELLEDSNMDCPSEIKNLVEKLLLIAPEKATWLGWSMGGSLASYIAVHKPHRVLKLILIASTPRFLASKEWSGINKNVFKNFITQLNIDKRSASTHTNIKIIMKSFLALQTLHGCLGKKDLSRLKQILFSKAHNLHALQASLKLLYKFDMRFHLKNIICETLWILGENDQIIPIASLENIKKLMPLAQYKTITSASHISFFGNEDLFLIMIRDFINDHK